MRRILSEPLHREEIYLHDDFDVSGGSEGKKDSIDPGGIARRKTE
jgi:hypothetical protein